MEVDEKIAYLAIQPEAGNPSIIVLADDDES